MARPRLVRVGIALLVAALPAIGLAACHGQLTDEHSGSAPPPAPSDLIAPVAPLEPSVPTVPAVPSAPPAVLAQIQQGGPLFAQTCARCHGASGEGSALAPAVIGARALPMNPPPGARTRRTSFRAAKDVGMFIMTTMPPGGPKVPPEQVACILAWLLHQNGATPTQAVSPATAGSMPIH